jgi:hypothetical protein
MLRQQRLMRMAAFTPRVLEAARLQEPTLRTRV